MTAELVVIGAVALCDVMLFVVAYLMDLKNKEKI